MAAYKELGSKFTARNARVQLLPIWQSCCGNEGEAVSQIESKGKDSTTITLARSMEEDAFDYHARDGVTVMQSRVSATHCRTRMPLPRRTLAWPEKSYHNVLSCIPRLTTIVSTQRLHAATYVYRACIASRRRACCRIALPCTNVNTFAACETKQKKKSLCVTSRWRGNTTGRAALVMISRTELYRFTSQLTNYLQVG